MFRSQKLIIDIDLLFLQYTILTSHQHTCVSAGGEYLYLNLMCYCNETVHYSL